MKRLAVSLRLFCLLCGVQLGFAETWPLWKGNKSDVQLVLPDRDATAANLARNTLNRFLSELNAADFPVTANTTRRGTYLVLGTSEKNPALAQLVKRGLKLTTQDIGEEGFQLLTHRDGRRRFIIAYARTPRALKHACQELVFYRWSATTKGAQMEVPLNVVMKPEFGYRGIYMLPCWSARDAYESWERVLRFNSELTLNRNWFWLDGFPVAGHPGEYTNTALADAGNVQRLLDLVVAEDMKIYLGGGWFTWHHEKAVGKNYERGAGYYLDYLKAFTNFHGFYIEPTGEGAEVKDWRPECDTLRGLIRETLRRRPDFEIALAIGKFNNAEYLKLMSELDSRRVFWWWCWGDPFRDQALDLYPNIVRWHLSEKMSDYHGSMDPPGPQERKLTGFATSYDPGQGYGNPWNGWGKLGYAKPRNFHPHTLPYFGQQYFFRERCWNTELSEADFLVRLQRRLFDADAPRDAVQHYWRLCQMAHASVKQSFPSTAQLEPERQFLDSLKQKTWTPRTQDTLARMEEAWRGLADGPARPKKQN